ncbi:serine hydrolase domain-containing protein [Jiangella gansuensis]|uniref:serine hydrolase domain-containing protein n=1 Tax=Jiangella gansuensis TaxID=281473 RepID=UPI000478FE8C|nr:serine hydrolase domain-containing protein [Jiangella gansuensis]
MSAVDLPGLVAGIEKDAEEYLATRAEATLMIGLSVQGERHVRSLRSPGAEQARLPDTDTIYEIGSVSKVFSTTVLAVLEAQGLIGLDDPIGAHLPKKLRLPPHISSITVEQLATHSSGLGSVGAIHQALIDEELRGTETPFATYTHYLRYKKEHLYADLENAELIYPTGQGWTYSVIGMGTLGHILELVAGRPYEQLLKETVCAPLGLTDTGYTLSPEQQGRVMHAYDAMGQPCPNWYHDVMLPQGGLRSTMTDLLTFVEANLAAGAGSGAGDGMPILSRAMRRARKQYFAVPGGFTMPDGSDLPDFVQGLGWRGLEHPEGLAWWHGGTTLFYLASAGVDDRAGVGIATVYSGRRALVERDELHALEREWFLRACQ